MKKFTSLILTFFMLIFVIPTNVNAATITDNSKDIKENIDFFNTFPDLKKNLDENGYDELIETQNQYFKVELKNKSLRKSVYDSSDFNFIKITEDEYNTAKITESLKSSVRGENDDFIHGVGGDSYLRLTLSIFRNSSARYKFSVTHRYEWIKPPSFTFKDAIGISVGPIMKIISNTWLSQSAHNSYVWDPSSPTGQTPVTRVDDNTDIKHSNVGVATKFDLEGATENEFGYISCEVQFSQTGSSLGHQSSNVFGNYIHTQIGFSGGLSIGLDGKPSIGANFIDKEYSYSADVGYN
ncbi:hypothetical protein [Clostridium tertium]|uniref:hypothetical protein n=1 Tax=Clostridium tertium TaxID=1559 RepID=UPI000DCF9E51|nr:hypothetical protein [Clostridium tertium]